MSFADHFSGHAADYSAFRPDYPATLFDRVAALVDRRARAWDCGTGNGQAAVHLAARFERVDATDASRAQIRHARPHPRVRYGVGRAEDSGLASATVDLVFVAQALHWFDHARFWPEVRRVARPGAAFVAVTYARCGVEGPSGAAIEAAIEAYYEVVEPYWPPERDHVEAGYATISSPFPALDVELPALVELWTLEALWGYLGTWSATRRAWRAGGRDPREQVRGALEAAWGDPEVPRRVVWPTHAIAGRVHPEPGVRPSGEAGEA